MEIKKIIAVTLVATALLSTTGCGGKKPPQDTTKKPAVTEDTAVEKPADTLQDTHEPTPFAIAENDGSTYKNTMLKIQADFGDGWSLVPFDSLLQFNNFSKNDYEDEAALIKAMHDAPYVYDMMALPEEGTDSVNIILDNIWMQYKGQRTTETYIDQKMKQIADAFDTSESKNFNCEKIEIDFAGGKYPAIKSSVELLKEDGNVQNYQLIVFVEAGDYIGVVTINAVGSDNTDAIAARFQAL